MPWWSPWGELPPYAADGCPSAQPGHSCRGIDPDQKGIRGRLYDPAMGSGDIVAACFHCGLPALDPRAHRAEVLGAVREFCSADCERVAQAIVDADSGAYYETREPPRAKACHSPPPEDTLSLSLYDEPAAQRQFVTAVGEHGREALLVV